VSEVIDALPGMPASRWVTLDGPPGRDAEHRTRHADRRTRHADRRTRHADRRTRHADRRTHYVDFGGPDEAAAPEAPLVVFVHGLGGSTVDWAALAPALTPAAQVLGFDLVGHGRTPGTARPADLRSHQEHLAAFLRQRGGRPAILVGNSMGGLVSLLQAAREPSSVSGLVLLDPALPVARDRAPDPLVAATFASYLVPVLAGQLLALRRRRIPPEVLVRQTLALITAHPENVPAEVFAAYVAQNAELRRRDDVDAAYLASARSLLALMIARPARIRQAMAAVRAPTLLLHGERDRLVPVRAARAAQAARPDWSLVVHPDAGHLPQLEDPRWVAAEILRWLPAPTAGPAGQPRPATRWCAAAPPAPRDTSRS
jgi:pimeloyl-ACP methyl ester carboxylesterase